MKNIVESNNMQYLSCVLDLQCLSRWTFLNKMDFPNGLCQVIAFDKEHRKIESCDRPNMWFAKNKPSLLMNQEVSVFNFFMWLIYFKYLFPYCQWILVAGQVIHLDLHNSDVLFFLMNVCGPLTNYVVTSESNLQHLLTFLWYDFCFKAC